MALEVEINRLARSLAKLRYREVGLRSGDWRIEKIGLDTAQAFVERHHYARGGANTATYRHGLFEGRSSICRGVAWWIPPTKSAALATYPANWQGVLALSRLVLAPDVPTNGATFLLAGSRRRIDRNLWPVLVTYADEWRGHLGGIYRQDNWTYEGKTKPEAVYTIEGRMVARKAGPTTRTHDEMIALGATLEGRYAKHKFTHRIR